MIVNGVTDSLTGVFRVKISTCPFTTIYPLTTRYPKLMFTQFRTWINIGIFFTLVPTDLLANKKIKIHLIISNEHTNYPSNQTSILNPQNHNIKSSILSQYKIIQLIIILTKRPTKKINHPIISNEHTNHPSNQPPVLNPQNHNIKSSILYQVPTSCEKLKVYQTTNLLSTQPKYINFVTFLKCCNASNLPSHCQQKYKLIVKNTAM